MIDFISYLGSMRKFPLLILLVSCQNKNTIKATVDRADYRVMEQLSRLSEYNTRTDTFIDTKDGNQYIYQYFFDNIPKVKSITYNKVGSDTVYISHFYNDSLIEIQIMNISKEDYKKFAVYYIYDDKIIKGVEKGIRLHDQTFFIRTQNVHLIDFYHSIGIKK